MSDLKLKVTVDESRKLFSNLYHDSKQLFKELYDDKEDELAFKSELWETCDKELRKAYEMSRYALDIKGLEGYIESTDIFKLNCEDLNGIDKVDTHLFSELMSQQTDLEDTLQYHASCRYSIPLQAEENFQRHVQKMNKLFDEMDEEEIIISESQPIIDINAVERLNEVVKYSMQNLKNHKKTLEYMK